MKKFEEEMKDNNLEILVSNTGSSLYGQSYVNYSKVVELSEGWISPEDHQAEVGKIELQNLKYREEIARMQKSLRKKNKAIKELNGAVKKNKERLKECEDLRIEANNEAAMEYSRKCEVVEERAELKRENQRLRAENLAVKTLVEDAKKQRPEIPEVPQFVAEYIERCKRSDCGLIWAVRPDRDANENSEKIYDWLYPNGVRLSDGTFPEPFEPDNLVRPDKENHIKFAQAWLNGYTVAKEKRFYLKNKFTGNYLSSVPESNDFYHIMVRDPKVNGLVRSFTQQEIDSMAADSYEKIEVQE